MKLAMRNVIPRPIWLAVFALSWLAAGCGSGTVGENPGIDECAVGNPCGDGVCSNLDDGYDCACDVGLVFDGVTCRPPSIAIIGGGSQDSPRTWANGALSLSCLDYLLPEPPYVYEGSTGDGYYTLVIDDQPVVVYCDMTTDGGGWTRLLFWDRESAPEVHTLASLQAQLIDELAELDDPDISPMGKLAEDADPLVPDTYYVAWWDHNGTLDALAYRRDVRVPNGGELLLDVHYDGHSMEKSSIWFYVEAEDGPHDILCWSDAENNANYSAAEHALIPYPCGADTSVIEFFWDTVDEPEQHLLDASITSFHVRSLHHDAWQGSKDPPQPGDASRLYRLGFYVR